VTNNFENKKQIQPIWRCNMHPRGLGFFLVEGRGEGDLSFFFLFWVRGLVNGFFSFFCPLKKLQVFNKFGMCKV
jgi:hypothetical protein